MGVIIDMLAWNIHFCFFLGVLFNFVAIWLIIKKSPKEMRVYSRILLQTAFADIMMVTGFELIHPRSFIWLVHSRELYALPYTMAQFLLAVLQNLIINFSLFGQAVQFLYRYLVLNRDLKISIGGYLCMLLFIPFVIFACAILFAIEGYPPENKRFIEDEEIAELITGSADAHPLLALRADSTKLVSTINFTIFILANISCYVIIIVCGNKMVKFVRNNVIKFKKHDLEKQLTRTLITMAIGPFLSMCTNLVLTCGMNILGKLGLSENNAQLDHLIVSILIASIVPVTWICVLNPLIVIWTIKPYRKAVIHVIKNKIFGGQ